MNEQYAQRLVESNTLEVDKAAFGRFSLLFDVIDFDSIRRICDVGTRFLEQTHEMSHIFTDAEFHSFEPVPETNALARAKRESLDPQKRDRISVYEIALSDKTEMIPFYPVNDTGSEHNVGASSKYKFVEGLNGSFFGKTWNQSEIQVQAMTMDDWRKQYNVGPVDLIWIDAQGGELDVFRGATETLKDVKVILSEVGTASYYQGQSLKPEIDAFLATQGFKELDGAWEYCHQFEGNTIYVRA
jgi:FkbM family methyltransferase